MTLRISTSASAWVRRSSSCPDLRCLERHTRGQRLACLKASLDRRTQHGTRRTIQYLSQLKPIIYWRGRRRCLNRKEEGKEKPEQQEEAEREKIESVRA